MVTRQWECRNPARRINRQTRRQVDRAELQVIVILIERSQLQVDGLAHLRFLIVQVLDTRRMILRQNRPQEACETSSSLTRMVTVTS